LRALLTKIDSIPERVLLWIHLALACLVGVAHGGALAITYAKPTADDENIRHLASVSLPTAGLIVLTAVIALLRPSLRRQTLAAHGWILLVGGIAALTWAASLLVRGIPQDNFSWSPGLLSVFVAYSVFVVSRYGVPLALRNQPGGFYAPLVALVIALPIDLGVFVTFLGAMSKRFG